MAFKITNEFPHEILSETQGPFISLYQPTHRHRPDNLQDITRFKNLTRDIESSLKEGYTKREIGPILEPFYALSQDRLFWNTVLDGLVILATKSGGIIYKLKRPVKELAVVADSFHIKPLIRVFQSADRYQVLGLSRTGFALYEGNRYGLDEIELGSGVARTAEEALGTDYSEKYFTRGSYAGVEGSGTFHGHGGKKEERQKYTESFFRYVDKFVLDNYSKPSKLPLMLIALPEHHGVFQSISRNPFLMKDGVKTGFDALTIETLEKNVWEKVEPFYLAKTKTLVDDFELAKAKLLASDELASIARAAQDKKVATIMIESDKIIPGKVDPATGEIGEGRLEHPEYDDVLDDLAEMVFNSKGNVVVLPKDRMPSATGAAAIFRY